MPVKAEDLDLWPKWLDEKIVGGLCIPPELAGGEDRIDYCSDTHLRAERTIPQPPGPDDGVRQAVKKASGCDVLDSDTPLISPCAEKPVGIIITHGTGPISVSGSVKCPMCASDIFDFQTKEILFGRNPRIEIIARCSKCNPQDSKSSHIG